MRASLLAAATLLTGCRSLIADGLGYVDCGEVQQTVFREYEHEDTASIKDTCGPNVCGCAFYNKHLCEIHYERGDILTRRHECTHCVRGEFHP